MTIMQYGSKVTELSNLSRTLWLLRNEDEEV